jgi:hypothetical protein
VRRETSERCLLLQLDAEGEPVDHSGPAPDSDRLEAFDVRLGGRLGTLFPGGDVISIAAAFLARSNQSWSASASTKEDLAASGR